MMQEDGFADPETPIRRAFLDAAHLAKWRETYKDTDIGDDFMNRFGCYCLIGEGGAFQSQTMAACGVYMPPHLHYPWHHHPAEEMYRVIGGAGRFLRKDMPDEWLTAGDACEHLSNQPHALDTEDSPIMAYVVWRNGFETPPVLTV
jgi:quercetin dioxygenase-like cupin family protein